MKKKKIMSLLALTLLSASIFVGCGSNNLLDFSSEETVTEFKNEMYRFSLGAQEKYTTDDFSANLEKFIEKADDSEKEAYITYYVQGLYKSASDLEEKLGVLGYDLEDIIVENKITELTYKNFTKASDEYATAKGFVKEVENEGFFLSRNVSTNLLTINVELENILNKYGKYMTKSLKSYYELNNYENKTAFFNDNSINIDEVANRIIKIEDGLKVDKESEYKHIDKWMTSYNYYYEILFGIGHEYYLSSGYYKEDVVAKYKELAEKYKDRELGKNLSSIVEVLEADNNKNSTAVSSKAEEIINSKLTANDNEIQKALESINSNMDIDDLAEKLGVSVEDLMGGSDTQQSTGENTENQEGTNE